MICSRLFKWSLRITGDSRGDLWMRPYFHFPFLEFENIFPKRTINKINGIGHPPCTSPHDGFHQKKVYIIYLGEGIQLRRDPSSDNPVTIPSSPTFPFLNSVLTVHLLFTEKQ